MRAFSLHNQRSIAKVKNEESSIDIRFITRKVQEVMPESRHMIEAVAIVNHGVMDRMKSVRSNLGMSF